MHTVFVCFWCQLFVLGDLCVCLCVCVCVCVLLFVQDCFSNWCVLIFCRCCCVYFISVFFSSSSFFFFFGSGETVAAACVDLFMPHSGHGLCCIWHSRPKPHRGLLTTSPTPTGCQKPWSSKPKWPEATSTHTRSTSLKSLDKSKGMHTHHNRTRQMVMESWTVTGSLPVIGCSHPCPGSRLTGLPGICTQWKSRFA